MNFVVSAMIEIVSYTLAYFTLKSILGRRYSVIIFQYGNAVFCLALGLLSYLSAPWVSVTTITVALIGKGFTAASFFGMFIYGIEVFPTVSRGTALGLCGILARVGSLLAPQILLLVSPWLQFRIYLLNLKKKYSQGELYHPMIPMAIMSGCLFLSGTATFAVPETLNKNLPNNLDDVERIWGKK